MFLRVLILAGALPAVAGADIMTDAPAAPAPRFDGHVTRADSRNALNRGDAAMARGGLPPDLIQGLIAVGLISAASAYGAKAAKHGRHDDHGHWDDWPDDGGWRKRWPYGHDGHEGGGSQEHGGHGRSDAVRQD
ncbi:hypothetical protein [Citreimonas salinaria]|uniref:Uncharacterized protein n=1 Tax=Citreimonas salinaria TaxID=321339 RepID=A0A1H3JH87_9RHOB|nr:hypothetical protein [Citreimonas salinaria]SDY38949.1 hypothetical protein SAMN05444340_10716 [Citreimonas salinaria]